MKVQLIAITKCLLKGDESPEGLLAFAGRVCYQSEARGAIAPFIQKRIEQGHESIIEHASASFLIEGISRACSHQLVRHRLASYSQSSQRYVEMDDAEFVMPPSILETTSPEVMAIWTSCICTIRRAYDELRDRGIKKEDARFLLPNATATRLVMTMNFRELRHFFTVRCDKAAQWEIRELALAMLRIMYKQAPAVFQDLVAIYLPDEWREASITSG